MTRTARTPSPKTSEPRPPRLATLLGVSDSFYVRDGERFNSTGLTRGPWDDNAQHGGPPSALLGRAVEHVHRDGWPVARFTVELLRPVPMAPLVTAARLVRPGRRVRYLEATMQDDDGQVARASAWQIRPTGDVRESGLEPLHHRPPGDEDGMPPFAPDSGESYFTAMDWKLASGTAKSPGPAAVWMRMRVPLVAGEDPTPLVRVLVAADSGSGVSWLFPPDRYLFVNTELTVHLLRPLSGEWVLVDSVTRIGPQGVGLGETVLWDEGGRMGSARQALLMSPR